MQDLSDEFGTLTRRTANLLFDQFTLLNRKETKNIALEVNTPKCFTKFYADLLTVHYIVISAIC